MDPNRSGARRLILMVLLVAIYIRMDSVSSEGEQQVSRVAAAPNCNQSNRTDAQIVSKRNPSSEPQTPSDLFLVSRGHLVREKAARVSSWPVDASEHAISEEKSARVWLTSGMFDDDPVGKDAAAEDIDLLQTIMNQTNGQNQTSDGQPLNYQDVGQLAGNSVSELNRSFLSLFDELWLIKNYTATALIRLNYFGNLSRDRVRAEPNQSHATPTGLRLFNRAKTSGAPHISQRKQVVASTKEQVAGRLSQAGLTIRGWLATAQQRLSEVKEKLVTPFRWTAASGKDSRPSTLANSNLHRLKPPLGTQATRSRRGIDLRFAGDFDVVWQQQQQQQQSSPCNKLTTDQENQCRAMERSVNSHLDDKFPGTMQAIEDNCGLINQLLTNCWIQQSIQLRMSLSSRNESLQRIAAAQPDGKKIGEPFRGLVNSCGVEPNSAQYIRDRVSWMWLNLCLDRRFRRGYTSNVYCLSVWTIPRAQQVCSVEYNRMQNYYSTGQPSEGQATNLGINFTWTGAAKSEPLSPVAKGVGDGGASGNSAHDNVQLPSSQQANQTVLTEAAATSAAGVSSSQLVAATTRGLSEAELVDREISSKMLCCMFDQFLRCIYKQAVWECGKRGAQFVVDFMSRIGTDDMKYLCNADSKTTPVSPETSSIPLLISKSNYSNVRPTAWAGPMSTSTPSEDNYRAPSISGQNNASVNPSNSSNRNPFLDNDYCVDSRIQNALASFNAASDMSEQTSSMVTSSPKVNPNRMRTPNYDPAYSDPRDTSASSANCLCGHQIVILVSIGSWLSTRIANQLQGF